MNEILLALGFRTDSIGRILLVGMFAGTTTAFVLLGHLLGPDTFVVFHIALWALWFLWQGIIFPNRRGVFLRRSPDGAYRLAFYRDILPGVSFGVSQMLRPLAEGVLDGEPVTHSTYRIVGTVVCVIIGLVLLRAGFDTIGVARAGFLAEYQYMPKPLIHDGIYRFLHHPLFFGGAITSFGGGLIFGEGIPATALINLAILPLYSSIENHRLSRIFGSEYSEYRDAAEGLAPRSLLPVRSVQAEADR